MAYRRPGTRNYVIERKRLVGYGPTGRISSGVRNRKTAERMERVLEELAEKALLEPRYRQLLDAVVASKTISPAELLAHRESLDELLVGLNDPLLSEVEREFRGSRDKISPALSLGLRQTLEYAGEVRISFFTPKRIQSLLEQAMRDGRKRNSVTRTIKQAISGLLRHHYGNSRCKLIMDDVHFGTTDDTRDVHLTPEEIGRLIHCSKEVSGDLALFVKTSILTSADRGELLERPGLRVMDVTEDTVLLRGMKTKHRSRTVGITASLRKELRQGCEGKRPDDPVLDIRYTQVDHLWQKARKKAGLSHVRIKDLRALLSQYGETAGVPLTVLSGAMGHMDSKMTQRYQKHQVVFTPEHADRVASSMGLYT